MAKLNRNLDFDSDNTVIDSDGTVYTEGQISRYEKLKESLGNLMNNRLSITPSEFIDKKRELIEEIKLAHLGGDITPGQMSHLRGIIEGRYKL